MKTILLCVLPGLGVIAAAAQPFTVNWSTIDAGGGTSGGGGFSLGGTIGQPDVGTMSGGGFALSGGYWAGAQTQSIPRLSITLAGGHAVVSWQPYTPGFVLQTNGVLSTIGWSDTLVSGTNSVTVPANLGTRFYRLRK